jgi:hypothetical protein
LRHSGFWLWLLLAGLLATAGLAQTFEFEGRNVVSLTPPRTAAGDRQASALAASGVQAQIGYLPKLAVVPEQKAPAKQPDRVPQRPVNNSIWLSVTVIAAVAAVLVFWAAFSGGALFAPNVDAKERKPATVPQGWAHSARDLGGQNSLLEIGRIADRRAALVRLLRLCLLRGAEATDTAFRKSDTEREALRRLPETWSGTGYLQTLLRATELAHYGGRSVQETEFQQLLADAAALLPRNGVANG